jgi:hypothetical protein
MRRKAQPEMVVKCDYCGCSTETFVATAEKLLFCINQIPGQPATKDCMEDYLNEKKKNQKESLFSQKKKQFQKKEEILIDKTSAIKKLDELKQFLDRKKTNHPS